MDQIEEIKKRLDVVEVLSTYMPLKKAGRSFRGACPFHQEKTPSFMVTQEKQMWYCFGCNQGGDIFTFIQKIEGVEFYESLRMLADRAGVALDSAHPQAKIEKGKKSRLYDILSLLEKFYHYYLYHSEFGKEAVVYLHDQRKISDDVIKKFSVGLVPQMPQITLAFLKKKSLEDHKSLIESGVFLGNRSGGLFDRFAGRIVFPIRSVQGQTVGFGGRLFIEKNNATAPKYLNSSQTDIYDKGSMLFGLDLARSAIRASDRVVVVEGYMDVIASHIAGVEYAVATCGTALTRDQLIILGRYTKNIIFCFDGDVAGMRALERVFSLSAGLDLNLLAMDLGIYKDPDELISTDPGSWMTTIEMAVPALERYYHYISIGLDKNDPAQKKKIAQTILPLIGQLGSNIEKAHYLSRISFDLGVPEKFLIEAIERLDASRQERSDSQVLSTESIEGGNQVKISRELLMLGIALTDIHYEENILSIIEEHDIQDVRLKSIYKVAIDCHNEKKSSGYHDVPLSEIMKKRVDQEATQILDLILFLTTTFFDDATSNQHAGDIHLLIGLFLQQKKERQKQHIQQQIISLDKAKDREKVKEMLKKLQELI